MSDLPASWARMAPYLFVAAAAVAVVAAVLGRPRRVDPEAHSDREPVMVGAAGGEAARQWTVSPPWEPALRALGPSTRRAVRNPLLGAAIGLGGFGLAIGREPVVVFLALFMVPTVALAPVVFRGRGGGGEFLAFAASDLALVLGLLHRYAASGLWATPTPGRIGAGALLMALAAGLRLAGVLRGQEGPVLARIGWFQGLFLAWWVGPSSGAALPLAAVGLWAGGIAAAREGRAECGLWFAGSLAALLAGLGAGAATIAVVGFAGISFAMGERAVSLATLALAPLSAPVTGGMLPALRPWLPAALAVFAVTWALALHRLLTSAPIATPTRARMVPAVAAGAGTAALLVTRGSETVAWAAYGLGLAAILAVRAVQPAAMHYRGALPAEPGSAGEHSGRDLSRNPGPNPGLGSLREAAVAALGAALLLVALVVLGGFTLSGLRTSFL